MDLELFKELGFTEREAKVYLALIELGSSTAGPIAARSGLQHAKVYETLQRLIEKGLVHYIVISKTKHFKAAPPKDILGLLDDRKRRFKEILSELELKEKYAKDQQIAVVHEGFKAFKALFDRLADELKKGDWYYVFPFKEGYKTKAIPAFFRTFHKKLEEKKVVDKVLSNREVKKEVLSTYKDNKNIKIKFTDFNVPIGIVIIKGKVIQVTWEDKPTAIEIVSAQIYKQYKIFFEDMWEKASK
ncbi:hypothetical protein COV18_05155 [Candidatus Woesearchaeota archaeon CG10_big_fil_rev_8_21_14_0_10_37_12]|nr:MAG: hypothetical protein COV18_05155 [Candidatus Woesearchaeota archaeon CG10_big_fil_rev_8_21_14_0_10_37_12]